MIYAVSIFKLEVSVKIVKKKVKKSERQWNSLSLLLLHLNVFDSPLQNSVDKMEHCKVKYIHKFYSLESGLNDDCDDDGDCRTAWSYCSTKQKRCLCLDQFQDDQTGYCRPKSKKKESLISNSRSCISFQDIFALLSDSVSEREKL